MYSFNLIDRPWIPCVVSSMGEIITLGIRDLLVESHNLKALTAETPLHRMALTHLLLAVLHRVFGPKDERAWQHLYSAGAFNAASLDDYLSRWYGQFDLFDLNRPFYQVDDPRVKPKSIIHLIHSMGNTGTLFTHANDATGLSLTPAQAARALVTAQAFRTAGLSGLPDKFRDGAMTRGVLFAADGATVFEMLMLNLVAYPASQYFPHSPEDKPGWEQDEAHRSRTEPLGYLDYLTWQSARVLLLPEQDGSEVVVRQIKAAPSLFLDESVYSPQKMYKLVGKDDKAFWKRIDFSEARALWRDYESLFSFDTDQTKIPAVMAWLHALASEGMLPHENVYHLRTAGLLADQAKPIYYRDQLMPLPGALLRNPDLLRNLQYARARAEVVEAALTSALKTFARLLLERSGDREPDSNDVRRLIDHWGALSTYWTRLETPYWRLVIGMFDNSAPALSSWDDTLKSTAHQLLEETMRSCGATHGSERAEVRATHELNKRLKGIFEPSAAKKKKGAS